MKKMIAIRWIISSPRVKIWKRRLKNSHYQIPSKGFAVDLSYIYIYIHIISDLSSLE